MRRYYVWWTFISPRQHLMVVHCTPQHPTPPRPIIFLQLVSTISTILWICSWPLSSFPHILIPYINTTYPTHFFILFFIFKVQIKIFSFKTLPHFTYSTKVDETKRKTPAIFFLFCLVVKKSFIYLYQNGIYIQLLFSNASKYF